MTPVLQDEEAHKHECPLCEKVYYCTEFNCKNIKYIQCNDCWKETVSVQ